MFPFGRWICGPGNIISCYSEFVGVCVKIHDTSLRVCVCCQQAVVQTCCCAAIQTNSSPQLHHSFSLLLLRLTLFTVSQKSYITYELTCM